MFRRNSVLLVTLTLMAALLAVVAPSVSPAGAAGPATCSYTDTGTAYDVSWDLELAATKHVIYRTVNGAGPYNRGAVDAPGTTFAGDAYPSGGGTVTYSVTAKDGNTELGTTSCTLVAPTVPTSCEVVDTGNGFTVTWDQTANDAVIVFRTVDGAGPYNRGRVDAPGLSFSDGALPSGATVVEYSIRHRVDPTNGSAIICTTPSEDIDALPFGPFATSDGVSSVELTWEDPYVEPAPTSIEIRRDGTVVGTVAPGTGRYTDTSASASAAYSVAAVYANYPTAEVDAATVTIGATGACRAIKLAGTMTAVLWNGPPPSEFLWLSEASGSGYVPLERMFDDAGVALSVDTGRDWGAANPDYRITSSGSTGLASEPCVPTALSASVIADLAAAGLPVLPDGRPGSTVGGGTPTKISSPVYGSPSSTPQAAQDVCETGGLRVDVPSTKDVYHYGTVYIPSGVTLTVDVVNHKGSTSNGDWGGRVRLFEKNADGSRGNNYFSGSLSNIAPYYWTTAGDKIKYNDQAVLTNNGVGREFYISIFHVTQNGVSSADDAHYRVEDFQYRDANGDPIGDPCGPRELLDCQAQGGNLVINEPFAYNGATIDSGCYDYDSCYADIGAAFNWLSEWACDNDDLLDAAGVLSVAFLGGMLIVSGNPILAGAGFGLLTSLWVCDTSNNGALIPAGSLGDVDPGCVAVQVTVAALTGGALGAVGSAGLSTAAATAISCTIGGVGGAADITLTAWVLPDENVELTPALISAGLGCATAGIIGGTQAAANNAANVNRFATPNPGPLSRFDPDFAVGQLIRNGDAPASDLVEFGVSQGWVRTQTPTGPIKFIDENNVVRLTIKSGSPRAPGSNFPHVELRNADGQRIDSFGALVTRTSPLNHTPIVWDIN